MTDIYRQICLFTILLLCVMIINTMNRWTAVMVRLAVGDHSQHNHHDRHDGDHDHHAATNSWVVGVVHLGVVEVKRGKGHTGGHRSTGAVHNCTPPQCANNIRLGNVKHMLGFIVAHLLGGQVKLCVCVWLSFFACDCSRLCVSCSCVYTCASVFVCVTHCVVCTLRTTQCVR